MPGFEIPQRYFDWLRRRDGRLLEDVFKHNRLDVVSMASLLKHLTDLVEDGQEMEAWPSRRSPQTGRADPRTR